MKAYSGKELIGLLAKHGWKVERVEGSHHILAKPGREEIISIPVHGSQSLKIGMVRRIVKIAGIEPE